MGINHTDAKSSANVHTFMKVNVAFLGLHLIVEKIYTFFVTYALFRTKLTLF